MPPISTARSRSALGQIASDLLAREPEIRLIDVLAVKLAAPLAENPGDPGTVGPDALGQAGCCCGRALGPGLRIAASAGRPGLEAGSVHA